MLGDFLFFFVQITPRLVLAPTRELVIQIFSVAEKLTSQSPSRARIQTAAVYGGTRKMDQLANLRRQRPGGKKQRGTIKKEPIVEKLPE